MKIHTVLLPALLIGATLQAVAAPQTPGQDQSSEEVTRHEQSTLTYSEQDRARQWDLTDTEWQRYKHLMQGVRGSLSPANLSPIEVLGIHAESDAERRRYAERWAQMLRDDTEKILAFQRAVAEANVRLYGNQPLIDVSQIKRKEKKSPLSHGDRLLFFTTTKKCSECDIQLDLLLSKTRLRAVGLDIFLLGTEGRDETVRQWAQAHKIPAEVVHRHTITLNHDNGSLARLSQDRGTPPYLMRQSDLGAEPVSMSDLW